MLCYCFIPVYIEPVSPERWQESGIESISSDREKKPKHDIVAVCLSVFPLVFNLRVAVQEHHKPSHSEIKNYRTFPSQYLTVESSKCHSLGIIFKGRNSATASEKVCLSSRSLSRSASGLAQSLAALSH